MRQVDPAQLRPWFGDPPRTDAPDVPGFTPIAHERVPIMPLSLAGVVLVPLWAYLFVGAIMLLGGRSSYQATLTPLRVVLGAVIALAAVPVAHEALHGLAARALGARPAFGIGAGFAYTTFREPLARWPYLAVGLAPLVVMSAAAIALGAAWSTAAGWLVFAAVANAAGAIGDLWMAWRIVRRPRNALFIDLADGFAVLEPGDGAR